MADSLKGFFSPLLVRRLADDIARVHPAFAARAFVKSATSGLEELELLDRGRHIARALAAHLPAQYEEAIDVLLRSLGPEHASDELVGAGMAPFFYLPHTIFVAEHGLEHFDLHARAIRIDQALQRGVEHPPVHRPRSGAHACGAARVDL